VWATQHRIQGAEEWAGIGEVFPAGRGLTNYTCLVLGPGLQALEPGSIGELYLGGAGMTRGYHARPDLNKALFVSSPFQQGQISDQATTSSGVVERGGILYKTGDLFSWSREGLLHYRGRSDTQVKVNGHRLEMGEIETTAERHEAVRRCVVLARSDLRGARHGVQTLVAYVQLQGSPRGGEDGAMGGVRDHLARSLPGYMCPTYWVSIQEWPLNVSNKVDRRALPLPMTAGGACPTAPIAIDIASVAGGINHRPAPSEEAVLASVVSIASSFANSSLDAGSSILEVGGGSRDFNAIPTPFNAI